MSNILKQLYKKGIKLKCIEYNKNILTIMLFCIIINIAYKQIDWWFSLENEHK